MWSWVLEAIGILGALLAGRKLWQGWLVLLCNAGLWATYGVTSKQYGFTAFAFIYAGVYLRNLTKWRNAPKELIHS